MKTTKCQWITAVIMCALALTQPMRAQSSNQADSVAVSTSASNSTIVIPTTSNASTVSVTEETSETTRTDTAGSFSTEVNVTTEGNTVINKTADSATEIYHRAETIIEGNASSGSLLEDSTSQETAPTQSPVIDTPQIEKYPNLYPVTSTPSTVNGSVITSTVASEYEPVKQKDFSPADSLAVIASIDQNSVFDPDSIIIRIDRRMVQMDSLIHSPIRTFKQSPEFLRWSASYTTDSLYLATLDKIAQAQASIIKAQSGIQLTGQTYYRPDAAFGIDEETDDVSRYVAKIQAEVRWYFLQSGIYNRHGRIQEINLKTDIERLEHLKNRAEPQLYANRERLRINSDSVLASIMLHRITNLEMLEQAYLYLLDNESVSSDNLLRVLDDRAEAERRLSTISTSPTWAPTLSYVQAGTVSIDTMAIFETIFETDLNIKILDKQSLLLDQQASNTRWLNDVRVAPFARYSHYFRHNMAVSANVDVGISFTVPINGEASRKRRALLLEKGLIDSKRDQVETSSADRVRYIVNEVYRLNRSITGEWQRAQSLKKYLKTRRQAYDRRQGEYNRLSALMEYNRYLRCLENIIEIQYRRDSYLTDLQSMMPETPLDRYCAFIPLYTHE